MILIAYKCYSRSRKRPPRLDMGLTHAHLAAQMCGVFFNWEPERVLRMTFGESYTRILGSSSLLNYELSGRFTPDCCSSWSTCHCDLRFYRLFRIKYKKINHVHLDVSSLPGAECLGEYPTSHSSIPIITFIFKEYFFVAWAIFFFA